MVGSPKAANKLRKTFEPKYIDAKGYPSSSLCGQTPKEILILWGNSSLSTLHRSVLHDWQIPISDEEEAAL